LFFKNLILPDLKIHHGQAHKNLNYCIIYDYIHYNNRFYNILDSVMKSY